MIESIKNNITLKDVYLNNAVRVDIGNEHDKTKHLFENVWMLQKYLVENTRDKETAYRIFADFIDQYRAYMANAIEYNTALNPFRQSGFRWPLSICPFKTTDGFEHIVLH